MIIILHCEIPPFGGILFDLLRFGFLYPIFPLAKRHQKNYNIYA